MRLAKFNSSEGRRTRVSARQKFVAAPVSSPDKQNKLSLCKKTEAYLCTTVIVEKSLIKRKLTTEKRPNIHL